MNRTKITFTHLAKYIGVSRQTITIRFKRSGQTLSVKSANMAISYYNRKLNQNRPMISGLKDLLGGEYLVILASENRSKTTLEQCSLPLEVIKSGRSKFEVVAVYDLSSTEIVLTLQGIRRIFEDDYIGGNNYNMYPENLINYLYTQDLLDFDNRQVH